MDNSPLISVVDDDEGVRRSLDGLCRSMGYRVTTFASAESFLKSSDALACSCVISDVQMPGMSGFELAHAVMASGSGTPIILISAFLDEKAESEAHSAGAHCFLRKPFDGDTLIQCLDSAMAA